MKHLIIGYARHGKDQLAEYLEECGVACMGSSWAACQRVVYPLLKGKYAYITVGECFKDRVNHREEWFKLIEDYNRSDPARLAKEIYQDRDVYTGMRSRHEFSGVMATIRPVVWWVDRSKHVADEGFSSNELTQDDADFIIDNNGSLKDLRVKARVLADIVLQGDRL